MEGEETSSINVFIIKLVASAEVSRYSEKDRHCIKMMIVSVFPQNHKSDNSSTTSIETGQTFQQIYYNDG